MAELESKGAWIGRVKMMWCAVCSCWSVLVFLWLSGVDLDVCVRSIDSPSAIRLREATWTHTFMLRGSQVLALVCFVVASCCGTKRRPRLFSLHVAVCAVVWYFATTLFIALVKTIYPSTTCAGRPQTASGHGNMYVQGALALPHHALLSSIEGRATKVAWSSMYLIYLTVAVIQLARTLLGSFHSILQLMLGLGMGSTAFAGWLSLCVGTTSLWGRTGHSGWALIGGVCLLYVIGLSLYIPIVGWRWKSPGFEVSLLLLPCSFIMARGLQKSHAARQQRMLNGTTTPSEWES